MEKNSVEVKKLLGLTIGELRERLALQKKMLIDEINSKKEENKLRMQERADELVNKAQRIQENRDRLRNMKEIERKLTETVKASDGVCWKFTSPGTAGVPDRIILMPGCRIAFVERHTE